MAGPQDVVIKLPGGHCFLVKTRPAGRLTRTPFFGPLLAYDLGKPVRFHLTVSYLGLERWAGAYDVDAKPDAAERTVWTEDIVLDINGESVGSGDELKINVLGVAFDRKDQSYTTKPFYLERPGPAQLQIGPPYQAGYMFEVKEASGTVVGWVAALATTLIGIGVGFWLGRI